MHEIGWLYLYSDVKSCHGDTKVLLVLKSLADDAKPIICFHKYVFFSAVGQCFIVLKETGTTI